MEVIVAKNSARIDKFLSENLGISRSLAQEYIIKGLVSVNNSLVNKVSKIIKEGDVVHIKSKYLKEDKFENIQVELKNIEIYKNLEVPILFENDDIICINKPVINVNKVGSNPSIYEYLIYKGLKPFIVHRLDKQTTGCLVVAKNYETAECLSLLFKNRKVEKIYFAVVEGVVKQNLEIHSAIHHTSTPFRKQVISYGKESTTIIKVKKYLKKESLARYFVDDIFFNKNIEDFTFLEVQIITGRTHQIRVHCSEIGHPIVGDTRYSSSVSISKGKVFLLHSHKISFELWGKKYEFSCLPSWYILIS